MDKIFSARLDEAVLNEMERVTRNLRITKTRFLEDAIRRQAAELAAGEGADVWAETLGAWERREKPATTVRRARRAFESGFARHQHARVRR